jgi:hypothetical protein
MRSVAVKRKNAYGANLLDEALLILDKRGAVLDLAREVSRLMRNAGLPGVVIGGIAVVLHGHLRTTKDVDIFMNPPLKPLADLLTDNGFSFDRAGRAFVKHGVPVHLVSPEQVGPAPKETVEIEGVTTVALPDLIGMKLRSGSSNLLRAQDLADVIGLIRHQRLTSEFARRLDKTLRDPFRKLVRLIQREKSRK